jgi:subtilase family protein
MRKKIISKTIFFFYISGLILLIGMQGAIGQEIPIPSEESPSQDGNKQEVSKPKLPLMPEPFFNDGPDQKTLAVGGEFLVKIQDTLLQKLLNEKSITSTKEAMKIWREHWDHLKKEKGKSQKEKSFFSDENLNKLGQRTKALAEVKNIIEKGSSFKSKPEILQIMDLLGILLVKVAEKEETADHLKRELLNAIKEARPGIINDLDQAIIVEQNYKIELHSHGNEKEPNDFYWHSDLDVQLTDGPKLSALWGLDKISMKEAWKSAGIDWTQPVNGDITLAVIDTGIKADHPDIERNLWENPESSLGNDMNGFTDDIHGVNIRAKMNRENCEFPNKQIEGNPFDEMIHGTHVAGIGAAIANNDDIQTKDGPTGMLGVVGYGPVSVMAVKIFCKDKSGSYDASYSHANAAIQYVIQMGAHVVNMSWSLTFFADKAEIIKQSMQSADNILFVVSAGNRGEDIDQHKRFPASFGSELENVLTVAATMIDDNFWPSSNKSNTTVQLAAPGDAIRSIQFHHMLGDATISAASGTSMAAPFVAGCAAFIQSVRQSKNLTLLPPKELRKILNESGDRIGNLDHGVVGGRRLNCNNALKMALGG